MHRNSKKNVSKRQLPTQTTFINPFKESSMKKILIACEFSGTVRDAFTQIGFDATSCDILPTDKPGKHYRGNVLNIINQGWDLMIAHPPCTHLAVSGARWFSEKKKNKLKQ